MVSESKIQIIVISIEKIIMFRGLRYNNLTMFLKNYQVLLKKKIVVYIQKS